jgi:hypothetical protein
MAGTLFLPEIILSNHPGGCCYGRKRARQRSRKGNQVSPSYSNIIIGRHHSRSGFSPYAGMGGGHNPFWHFGLPLVGGMELS